MSLENIFWILSTLSVLCFLISLVREKKNKTKYGLGTGEEEEDEDQSSGEIAEVEDTENPHEDNEAEGESRCAFCLWNLDEEDPVVYVDPLAEAVSEIVIRLVKGCTSVVEEGSSGTEGDLLYRKYKLMASGEDDGNGIFLF